MTYAWQGLDAVERMDTLSEQRPPAFPYGCRVSEDFVLAGQEVARWFSSPHELVTWFAEEPDLERFDDETKHQISARLTALADAAASGQVPYESLSDLLSAELKGWIALGWFGTFRDLCDGDSETAQELRQWFREGAAESPGPVTPAEEAAFADFLHEEWRL